LTQDTKWSRQFLGFNLKLHVHLAGRVFFDRKGMAKCI
jgi:hypothetical protein